jgi:hypothetical protein
VLIDRDNDYQSTDICSIDGVAMNVGNEVECESGTPALASPGQNRLAHNFRRLPETLTDKYLTPPLRHRQPLQTKDHTQSSTLKQQLFAMGNGNRYAVVSMSEVFEADSFAEHNRSASATPRNQAQASQRAS